MAVIHDGGKIAAAALAEAAAMKGVPYKYGGNDRNGIDCSGLVQWCFSVGGMPGVPKPGVAGVRWTVASLRTMGESVPIAKEQPGDLIFPKGETHVGICLKVPPAFQMIDAPRDGIPVGVRNYGIKEYDVRRLVDPTTGTVPDLGTPTNETTLEVPILSDIVRLLRGIVDVINSIGTAVSWLTHRENWIRIGVFVMGAALLIGGLVYLENT